MRDLPQIIDYDKDQLAYALANALKERDEAREELRTAVQERHDFHWELQDAIRERNEARNLACVYQHQYYMHVHPNAAVPYFSWEKGPNQ